MIVAVDIETVSLKDPTMIGIGVAWSDTEARYYTMEELDEVLPILRDADITKVYHNGTFDMEQLAEYNIDMSNIGDTAIMARLLGLPGSLVGATRALENMGLIPETEVYGMKEVMDAFLEVYGIKSHKDCRKIPQRYIAEKCMLDAKSTYSIHAAMRDMGDDGILSALGTDLQVLPILIQMGRRGIKLDPVRVDELVAQEKETQKQYLDICQSMGLDNPNSPPQTAKALMKRGVLFPKKVGGKWKVSTKADALKGIDDVLAKAVTEYRHYTHNLSQYLLPLVGHDRTYTHFHLEAATSRMQSHDPNLNNVPGEKNDFKRGGSQMRSMYLPDTGTLTSADAGQMQLRILAHLSQDPVMMRVFEGGGDIHQETADYFGRPRDHLIKAVNFGVVFGATEQSIMDSTDCDRSTATDMLRGWFKKYKHAGDWIQYMQEVGVRDGYVYTDYGRKLYIPLGFGRKGLAHAKRCCVNYPIQGTEAEIVKRWILLCAHLPLILVIHDELVFDGYLENIPNVDGISNYPQPIGVSYSERWS